MENFLAEGKAIKVAVEPQDLNGGVAGSRIDLRNIHRVGILINIAAGSAAVLNVEFKQHDAITAGVSKDISLENRYFYKKALEVSYTEVKKEGSPYIAQDLISEVGTDKAVVLFEILPEDLDVNGGFGFISINVNGDAGRIASASYICESKCLPAYEVAL